MEHFIIWSLSLTLTCDRRNEMGAEWWHYGVDWNDLFRSNRTNCPVPVPSFPPPEDTVSPFPFMGVWKTRANTYLERQVQDQSQHSPHTSWFQMRQVPDVSGSALWYKYLARGHQGGCCTHLYLTPHDTPSSKPSQAPAPRPTLMTWLLHPCVRLASSACRHVKTAWSVATTDDSG